MTAIKDSPSVQAIKALIQSFFDRINARDPSGLQHLFIPGAHLTLMRQDPPQNPPARPDDQHLAALTPADNETLSIVIRLPIEAFIRLIEDGEKRRRGQPPGPAIHEAPDLGRTEIRVDGLFATAWCPFRVMFDGQLHHYGTFGFTFGRRVGGDGDEWRVGDLTQKYRRVEGLGEGMWEGW